MLRFPPHCYRQLTYPIFPLWTTKLTLLLPELRKSCIFLPLTPRRFRFTPYGLGLVWEGWWSLCFWFLLFAFAFLCVSGIMYAPYVVSPRAACRRPRPKYVRAPRRPQFSPPHGTPFKKGRNIGSIPIWVITKPMFMWLHEIMLRVTCDEFNKEISIRFTVVSFGSIIWAMLTNMSIISDFQG